MVAADRMAGADRAAGATTECTTKCGPAVHIGDVMCVRSVDLDDWQW